MSSFSDALKGHDNALGFLRLLLATLVIVDHAMPLGGFGENLLLAWSGGQDTLGRIAVTGFFAISGYLITKSAGNADSLQFFWRRALRIFPAYWAMLLVVALIVAPVLWYMRADSLVGYFQRGPGGPLHYLYSNMFLHIGQFGMHDLLIATTPYGLKIHESVFNGSIWTLIYEWRCYVLVGALAAVGIVRRMPWLLALLALVLYFLMLLQLVLPAEMGKIAPRLTDPYTIRYTFLFVLGGVVALFGDRIVVDDRIGFAACAIYLLGLKQGGYLAMSYPAMVYILLWLAVRLPDCFKRVGTRNDYSYGVYLYGFPVQQVLAHVGLQSRGLIIYTATSILLAFFCAYLSWHLVEKWALALKETGPGRGVQYWRQYAGSFLGRLRETAR